MMEAMRRSTHEFWHALLVITVCGAMVSIGQIIMVRELLVLFCGNELSAGLVFAAWLLWTALGSRIGARYGGRPAPAPIALPAFLGLIALLLPISVLWIRATRILWAIPLGELISPLSMLAISFAGTGPFCMASGMLFGLAWSFLALASDKEAAQPLIIYLGEALGAAAGGVFFYFVLLPRTSIFLASVLIALVVLLVVVILLGVHRIRRGPAMNGGAGLPVVLLAALALVGVALACSSNLDRESRRWQWGPKFLTVRDTPFQNLALLADANQVSFFANGLLLFSVPDPEAAEYAVHPAMLQHPEPASVLLVGGGAVGFLEEILKHPGVRRVDYVEPDPEVIELAEEFLPASATAPLLDRRVHLRHADATGFMRTTTSRYDVIIMQLGDPLNAEMNRFYTVEFYRLVARLLEPGGILSFAVTSSPDMVGPAEASLLSSVYRTLHSVFPGVLVIPGASARFLAGAGPEDLTAEPRQLIERLTARHLDLRYVREYYLFDYLSPTHLNYLRVVLEESQALPVNRDFEPTCYANGLLIAATQSHPLMGEAFLAISRVGRLPFWILVSALAMGMLLPGVGGCGKWRRVIGLNVMIAGGAEMVLTMVLLLTFQLLEGFLYRQLALIIACYMAGAALGTGVLSLLSSGINNPRKGFAAAQFLLALYLLGIPALFYWIHEHLQAGPSMMWPVSTIFALLAGIAGILGGCHFSLGVQASAKVPGYSEATGPGLYAMDLIGATGGTLLASLFILPLYGMPTALWVLSVFCFAGVLTILGKKAPA